MKKFTNPEMEISTFEVTDVITTSNTCDSYISDSCQWELPE